MLGHPQRAHGRGTPCYRHQPTSSLSVCWANVGRSSPCHITILEKAWEQGIDVICVQEPFTAAETRTSTHPGYNLFAPVLAWDNPREQESERPRVMTYVRKGSNLRAQTTHPRISRDLLWVTVNGYTILNVYRRPLNQSTLDYITTLTPPPQCLIGGDFNARHETFEPGSTTAHGGGALARWSTDNNIDYIGEPGQPTHQAGHVLDLTFSNIPFATSTVRDDLHSGSDHSTQVTSIPSRGKVTPEQYNYWVPEPLLPRFSGLVELGMQGLPDSSAIKTQIQLEQHVTALTAVLTEAIETAGKPDRERGRSAPWWTDECRKAYRRHTESRNDATGQPPTTATREFLATVRKAKRAYWRDRIDNIKDDKALYKQVGWHKLTANQPDTPLIIDGKSITEPQEKAEVLRQEILNRFSAEDDLANAPSCDYSELSSPLVQLPWERNISIEEVEANTIGVSSTSPGTDRITVRLLKACWTHIKLHVQAIYQNCLQLSYFPTTWKVAEVAMIPKSGKKDRSSPRSWRPIALLSCLSKGLERIVARRIAWTAITHNVLSPQHCGALPKRSAMDLIASLTHDVEHSWAAGKHVTMVTMDVQGAFDALLKNRLLHRMAQQGWPPPALDFVNAFLTDRRVQVRLGKDTTPRHPVACGTPQGSPLSPVLYNLYLAELLNQDRTRRFGYADDVCLYRASHSLDENVSLLAEDIRSINEWGAANKIVFAPEKLEMIHLTRQHGNYAPNCEVHEELTIAPIAPASDSQQALRWLGVWFDRKLTFKKHVATRAAAARKVALHLRSLGNTAYGPPASALRKAVMTCILPTLLYGAEAWYEGGKKIPRTTRNSRDALVSTRVGGHIATMDQILTLASRAVLPAWRTTPNPALLREAGLPSATVALEEVKLRFALHLQTTDNNHPLTHRIPSQRIGRGRGAGGLQQPKSKVQRIGLVLPPAPRPALTPPHYSKDCRTDPTRGQEKKKAAAAFNKWWEQLPATDLTIFSDGSEQLVDGEKRVTYGYAIYQHERKVASGRGSLNPQSHVFDAEAVGAWRGLRHAIRLFPSLPHSRTWLCIDSTSVIWCLRGNAPPSSQWAFLRCQEAMEVFDVQIRWAPGHTGITGNEEADSLAEAEAKDPSPPTGHATDATVSGVRSIAKRLLNQARKGWWAAKRTTLSAWYNQWSLPYTITETPSALSLPRPILARLLAIRTMHGDFAWYHQKFKHQDANLGCKCGRAKTPEHIVLCRKTLRTFSKWPRRPITPPTNQKDGIRYLAELLSQPDEFEALLELTEFYTKICTR